LSASCAIKPPYGACSRSGLVAFASSLDTPGAFARTAEDCALLLSAMAGHDARDATSLDRAREDYARVLREPRAAQPRAAVRIGLPREYLDARVDREVAVAIDTAIAQLVALGATT